jgi:hypothetical protein
LRHECAAAGFVYKGNFITLVLRINLTYSHLSFFQCRFLGTTAAPPSPLHLNLLKRTQLLDGAWNSLMKACKGKTTAPKKEDRT